MPGVFRALGKTKPGRECQRLSACCTAANTLRESDRANLTSAREQLAAVKRLASAQFSAELEMSPDVLVF